MTFNFKLYIIHIVCTIFFTYNTICKGYCKKDQYINLERPHLLYFNEDFASNITIKSQRVSRKDPVHYVNISFNLKKNVNNEYKNSFYVYQLLSNVYKRSFVELHYDTCELLKGENMFSATLVPAYYRQPISKRVSPLLDCPLKPGFYRFDLMKIQPKYIPNNFPFNEGRAYYNLTWKNQLIANVYIDFELMMSN